MPVSIAHILTHIGLYMARPGAFGAALAFAVLWLIFERETFDWHAVATLATLLMTLFIQRTEHRDTQAIQAKLDELLHATGRASNALTKLDDEEPEEIEKHRARARKDD